MKKIENDKKYIQVKDVLFIEQNELLSIPSTLYQKLLMCGSQIFSTQNEQYLEITTDDENKFFDSLEYIYEFHTLEKLTYDEIIYEIKALEKLQFENDKINQIINYNKLTLKEIKSNMEKIKEEKNKSKLKKLFKFVRI